MHSNMLQSDPPDHARLRTLAVKAFTPQAVEKLRGRIEEIADDLLAQIDDQAPFDLMDAFATPLPLYVISELLGVPTSSSMRLRNAAVALTEQTGREEKGVARATLTNLLAELIARKRKQPTDDLISRLIEATDAGDPAIRTGLDGDMLRHTRCRFRNDRQPDRQRCSGAAEQSRPTRALSKPFPVFPAHARVASSALTDAADQSPAPLVRKRWTLRGHGRLCRCTPNFC